MEQNNYIRIKKNIEEIKDDVYQTAIKYNRNPDDITIVGVSKRFPAEFAQIAFECGIDNLGENRVEELLTKKENLDSLGLNPKWHMIGSLQRKKVKKIIGQTHMIHSVDSLKLFNEIVKESEINKQNTAVLLQVNLSGEESKHGFSKEEILHLLPKMVDEKWTSINGIMTMAPFTEDNKILENVFYSTKVLFEEIEHNYNPEQFDILSMGMSNDYKIAIKHGATHIRVGTAIFGERPN